MLKKMVFVFVMNWALAAVGQELTLTATPSALSVLPGAPMPVALTVTNLSGRDLWIVGETLQRGIELREASLVTENDKRPPCETYNSEGFQATSSAPPSSWPKVLFKKGGTYSLQSGIYSQNTCPLEAVPPGRYRGKLAVRCRLIDQTGLREIVASAEIAVDVCAPSGQDLAFLHELKRASSASDAKAPSGCADQVKPLEWGEVLSSRRLHPWQIALKDFPTSTYAGYALLPAGACIPDPRVFLVNFLEHDKTAERWPQTAGQMASEKKKDLEDNEKRVTQLSAYLKARPDFPLADALKVELAGRLAMLGRFDEAHALCDEITLKDVSSLESKKANMLKDFLAEKGYPGKKKDVASPEPRQTTKPSNEKKP